MTELKCWVRENATLVYFLIAQAGALIGGGGVLNGASIAQQAGGNGAPGVVIITEYCRL